MQFYPGELSGLGLIYLGMGIALIDGPLPFMDVIGLAVARQGIKQGLSGRSMRKMDKQTVHTRGHVPGATYYV